MLHGRRWWSLMEKGLFGGLSPDVQQAACPHSYSIFMNALQCKVRECGMEAAIAPARTCAPWDRLKAAHAGDSAKRHLFNADTLAGTLCINSIWQSSIATQDGTQAHAAADKQHDANSAWRLVSDLWRANVVPFKRQRQKGKPVPRVQGLTCNTVEVRSYTDGAQHLVGYACRAHGIRRRAPVTGCWGHLGPCHGPRRP